MVETIRVFLSTLMIIALISVILRSRWFRHRMSGHGNEGAVSIVFRRKLSAHAQICIVSIRNNEYVIGLTPHSIALLKHLGPGDRSEMRAAISGSPAKLSDAKKGCESC